MNNLLEIYRFLRGIYYIHIQSNSLPFGSEILMYYWFQLMPVIAYGLQHGTSATLKLYTDSFYNIFSYMTLAYLK